MKEFFVFFLKKNAVSHYTAFSPSPFFKAPRLVALQIMLEISAEGPRADESQVGGGNLTFKCADI